MHEDMTKQQLAQEYFPTSKPHTAVCHLMSWINRNLQLKAELKAAGYAPRNRILTYKQVEIIKNHLGDP